MVFSVQSRFDPLQDEKVKNAFLKHLRRLSKEVLDGAIDDILVDMNDNLTDEVRIDKVTTRRFPAEYVRGFAAAYVNATAAEARTGRDALPLAWGKKFGTIAYLFISRGADGNYLEFRNVMPRSVTVDNIQIAGAGSVNDILVNPIEGAVQLLPAVDENVWPRFLIRQDVDISNLEITARARMAHHKYEYDLRSIRYFVAAENRPFAIEPGNGILKTKEFLDTTAQPDTVVTKRGNWTVNETLVIPPSVTWRIEAGAELRFAPNARVIVRGRILSDGNSEQPIVFAASGNSWKGVQVVQGRAQSVFKHTEFSNIDGSPVSFPGVTGAVTIYETPILMNGVKFRDISAEDSLNIVNSQFEVSDIWINSVRSDAIDIDFSKGTISGGRFEGIGGDGVDTSGSMVNLNDLKFNNISEKALSVGEKSKVTAENIVIRNTAIGIVSKNLSTLDVRQVVFGEISKYGLMAYQKNPFTVREALRPTGSNSKTGK